MTKILIDRAVVEQALEALETVFMPHHPAVIALKAALEQPETPPEAQTEAEKIAYCAGWWAALEQKREQPEQEPHWLTKELMADYLDMVAEAIDNNSGQMLRDKAYWLLRRGDA
jgi:hypothetical protein